MTDGVRTRPMTGDEYLESLGDGHEIWIYGERVGDVTTHPAFRNSARMIARMYDALHDPKYKDVLTTDTDTGSGGYAPLFQGSQKWGRAAEGSGCDSSVGPFELRLNGARPGLQGVVSRNSGGQFCVLPTACKRSSIRA